jgi:hypothetical protein
MLNKQKPGEPIKTRTINDMIDGVEGLSGLSTGQGFGGQGYQIAFQADGNFPAKLSGTASPYSFAEVYGTAGGAWAVLAGGRSGTTNAYEYNAKASLANKVVMLKPHWPGAYKFSLPRKPAGSGGGGIATSYCPCPFTPRTINLTSSDTTCDGGLFQSCIVYYDTTPAWALPLLIGASSYLSTTSFPDPTYGAGYPFYYHLACVSGSYTLSRVYQNHPTSSPYRDVVRYSWPVPWPGNSCTPFALTFGRPFTGSSCANGVVQATG